MKTSNILLWIAVAAVTAFTIYQARHSQITTPFLLAISDGTRVQLKKGDYQSVQTFENLLISIDPTGQNGTQVNILYQDQFGKWETVNGPPFGNPQPAQPGSMHVTERIAFSNLEQLNDVLNSLAPDTSTGANTPTPTPTP